jgi:two-component system, OmpR family, sensor histidine kinase KdpD
VNRVGKPKLAGVKLAGHPVELEIAADLWPVYLDATLIVQMFVGLWESAAKYTPAGTHISILAAEEGAFIRVVVEDSGPGLPPGDPARLFDKFQRGNEEGTIAGVGLGLACQAVAHAHGGEIEAHRRAGGHARFEVTLLTGEPGLTLLSSVP